MTIGYYNQSSGLFFEHGPPRWICVMIPQKVENKLFMGPQATFCYEYLHLCGDIGPNTDLIRLCFFKPLTERDFWK